MLGYSYCARYLDEEILGRLENKPRGFWTEEENSEYRSMELARWETAGYPLWPKNLVEEGVAEVDNRNVLNSVFRLPLKFVIAHITEPNINGPLIIQETGSAMRKGSKIGLKVHDDRISQRDPDEIIELERWDMS